MVACNRQITARSARQRRTRRLVFVIALLDTFVVVRALDGSLPEIVKRTITEADAVFISAASAWELATKYRIGKFPQFSRKHVEDFAAACADLGARSLAIEAADGTMAGLFDSVHRDPFDRVIGAQAVRLDATVITPDVAFDTLLGVSRWWRIES